MRQNHHTERLAADGQAINVAGTSRPRQIRPPNGHLGPSWSIGKAARISVSNVGHRVSYRDA